MTKRLVLVALLTACLAANVSAEEDSVIVGSYKVNFDLGMSGNPYTVTVAEPKTTSLLAGNISAKYEINIINDTGITRFAYIILTQYKEKQSIPSPEEMQIAMKQVIASQNHTNNVQASIRTIDGTQGAVASCEYTPFGFIIDAAMALYYPELGERKLECMITSTYPRNEGTSNLLKTIHIEKANATA